MFETQAFLSLMSSNISIFLLKNEISTSISEPSHSIPIFSFKTTMTISLEAEITASKIILHFFFVCMNYMETVCLISCVQITYIHCVMLQTHILSLFREMSIIKERYKMNGPRRGLFFKMSLSIKKHKFYYM